MKLLLSILFGSSIVSGCMSPSTQEPLQYVALGDSYTIGQSVAVSERWPNVLVSNLNANGVSVQLAANPSKTGWTTHHVLNDELPIMVEEQADFVTLLIGVNDYVQGVPVETFEKNINAILDHILSQVGSANRVVVITIPDFGVTPAAAYFGDPTTISAGIAEFNSVLQEAAAERNIAVADIYEASQNMADGSEFVLDDGIHPSAAEYVEWEKIIYPVVYSRITK